ncbi:unnamed protein product [Linum trigynum]|uniref:CCHC-type domain-containing protein n=1 Tax=Linum trigynum TaxID=586398 RepID=A0AAV2ELI3_9ROSI
MESTNLKAKETTGGGDDEGGIFNPTAGLKEKLNHINLDEDEDEPLEVADEDVDVVRMEAVRHLGLVGRLLSEKEPNIKSLKYALTKARGLKKGYQITELGHNLFAFQFLELDDRNKVCYGGPWHYENNAMLFTTSWWIKKPTPANLHKMEIWIQIKEFPAELRTQSMAEKIVNRIGEFVYFDDSSKKLWDDFLRLRVSISINNPLKKKIKLNVGGELMEFLVKYEKLPLFCHSCGRIGHIKTRCPQPSQLKVDPFGFDLRTAPPVPRNWLSHRAKKEEANIWSQLRRKFDMESSGSNSEKDTSTRQEDMQAEMEYNLNNKNRDPMDTGLDTKRLQPDRGGGRNRKVGHMVMLLKRIS